MSWGGKPSKYRPGRYITTMTELILHIEAGGWFWAFHKPQHPKVFVNIQFAAVLHALQGRGIQTAEINPEWTKYQERHAPDFEELPI
jgi:hypothetical protein